MLTRMASKALLVGAVTAGATFVAAASASAQGETFTASPTSLAPGGSISVQSVAPCTLPAGVTGAPQAELALTRNNTTLGRATIVAAADGSWSGSVPVDASAAGGSAQLTAFCIASPQAEGALFEYQAVTVTITGNALARTGSSTAPAATAVAIGLLALGAAFRALAPRRVRRAIR
jgi:hypothetical protein